MRQESTELVPGSRPPLRWAASSLARVRALRYGMLVAFLLMLCLVLLGAVRVLGRGRAEELVISVAVTAFIALAYEPAERLARRVADRVVYGERPSPEDVLSLLSAQVSTGAEGFLPDMARVVAEATGARQAAVWLKVGRELVSVSSWPPASSPAAVRAEEAGLPSFPGADRVLAVRDGAEILGALTVAAGRPISPGEDRLLADLSGQAGLVLRNARLRRELAARLEEMSAQAEELRSSRGRIVAAHDRERQLLERDMHDGAQQHLVALAAKVGLAKSVAAAQPKRARRLVAELRTAASEARSTLRRLASETYPAVLAQDGLAAAIRDAAPGVVVHDGTRRRFPAEAELAVYFCCLEAVQNALKHAGGSRIEAVLLERGGRLRFEVTDDGVGFSRRARSGSGLQNMRDRLAAAGGRLTVRSVPGEGTSVRGSVPV